MRSSSWMRTSSASCRCSPAISISARTARRWTPSAKWAPAPSAPTGISWNAPIPTGNFETAFYRSTIADNNSYEQWEAEGAQDALKRANTLWKKMLSEYEAPPIDPGVDEALLEYIAKKKAAVPDFECVTADDGCRKRPLPMRRGILQGERPATAGGRLPLRHVPADQRPFRHGDGGDARAYPDRQQRVPGLV